MMDFDIILGIDYASIQCQEKKIVIAEPRKPIVVIKGIKYVKGWSIVSTLKAHKLILKGYQAYLVSVVKLKSTLAKLEEIEVVSEFLEVFPNDL